MLSDIIKSYSDYNNLNVVAGAYGIGDVFYPFLLMDAQYSIYQKDILPIKCKRELKRIKSKWSDAYARFNKQFFAPFTQEQKDEIIDMMDAYSAHINNALMNVRIAVMNAISKVGDCSFEEQKVLSACSVCNILAQCANIAWEEIHLNSLLEKKPNIDLVGIAKHAHDFCSEYMRLTKTDIDLNLNEFKAVDDCMDVLYKKIFHFPELMEYKKGQRRNGTA